MKRKDKPPPEIAQLQYDRGIQRLSPRPETSSREEDDWPGKEFGLPRPGRGMWVDGIFVPADADAVEFTQPGPRRPGRS